MAITFTPSVVSSPRGVQGSYPQRLTVGHEGMLADITEYKARTYINQTGAALPIGAMVQIDPTGGRDAYAARLAASATQCLGIVMDQNVSENAALGAYQSVSGQYPGAILAADGRPGIPDQHSFNVMHEGVLWVYSAEAVNIGDAVRFFRTNYSGTLANAFQGRFGKTAVASNTVLMTGARWLSKTTAAGLAMLEISLPASTFTND